MTNYDESLFGSSVRDTNSGISRQQFLPPAEDIGEALRDVALSGRVSKFQRQLETHPYLSCLLGRLKARQSVQGILHTQITRMRAK